MTEIFSKLLSFLISFSALPSSICERLKNLEKTSKLVYHENILDGFIVDETTKPLSDAEFFDFNKRIRASSEECYLVSKFEIKKDRLGVISFNVAYEGDTPVSFYSLNISEKCKVIKSYRILTSEGGTMFYNISSKIKPNYGAVTITEEYSSEENMEGKIDTLFTNVWKINLKSNTLDTIYKKSSFRILKSPPQK